jgi:hypothetical protein
MEAKMPISSTRAVRTGLLVGAVVVATLAAPALRADNDGDFDGDRASSRRGPSDGAQARVRRGFEIVPKGVQLNLSGKNRALVGLGSYIVNAQGGCNDCHTHPNYAPGSDPFQGQPEMIDAGQYMAGGRQFGPLTASNITPDHAGRPNGLTRSQFIEAMRTGHDPRAPAGKILQVMPWPVYGKMTDHDLSAVYEFLRSIPSLPDNPNPGP